ncbi:hypothetical protein [Adlercreutzia shanghongiae]|uniref:DUF559 domain-containing protein n=1 Tax=Adlercreutzia shanghongiae TaxID=3111773 RepID=A0ABU6IZK7_9ACTN|nr:hypothetical protein [Adlercreutzia sp. R22]MEC4295259.1 hypothetical protein [Adlercreutzia sp. R22]
MDVILAYSSALSLMSHIARNRSMPFSYEKKGNCSAGAIDARTVSSLLKRFEHLERPLHLAVPSASSRRILDSATFHQIASLEAAGASWRIGNRLCVTSPALCLAQFASSIPFENLAELACSLAGNYRFATSPNGSVVNAIPLTTLDEMSETLASVATLRGRAKALRATEFAIGNLGSPFETVLYLLLCLPRKHGGFGFPKPLANPELEPSSFLQSRVSQRHFYPDLLWPEHGVIVEYDGERAHSETKQMFQDARRRNELGLLGYSVIVVTKQIIYSQQLMANTAEQLRRAMGLSAWKITASWQERHRTLRNNLLHRPAPLSVYWR